MENEKTARRKTRSKAGFDKEAVLEAVSAGAAEAFNRPPSDGAPTYPYGRRIYHPESWYALVNNHFKRLMLYILRNIPADDLIMHLEALKIDIREKDHEITATNFANAVYPPENKD